MCCFGLSRRAKAEEEPRTLGPFWRSGRLRADIYMLERHACRVRVLSRSEVHVHVEVEDEWISQLGLSRDYSNTIIVKTYHD